VNAAAIAVPILLILIIIIIIGILLFLICVKGWKPWEKKEEAGNAMTLTDMAPKSDELSHPFAVGEIAHVVQTHRANSDIGFSDQWDQLNPIGRQQAKTIASMPYNESKNRYANIHPYDHSIVKLTTSPSHMEGSDYINANYLRGYSRDREYIATQGPLPSTRGEFYRMVWEQNSVLIAMVTNEEERRKVKCQRYWPQPGTITAGEFTITMKDMKELPDYLVRTFTLEREGEKEVRKLTHLQYTGWPDHGVPRNADALLRFCRHARRVVKEDGNPRAPAPVIVHCSAGVGRSGTFITVDAMLQAITDKAKLDVLNFVYRMRLARMFMIQTEPQYIFVHTALLDSLDSTYVPRHEFASFMRTAAKNDKNGMNAFERQFDRINLESQAIQKSSQLAMEKDNSHKNRYANILPYDVDRFRLHNAHDNASYINASVIPGYRATDKGFIAAAAPLEATLGDFWTMVVESRTKNIVCLTDLAENGREKCTKYWPDEKQTEVYGNVTVTCVDETNEGDYITSRTFTVVGPDGREETVKHWHYLGFPWDDMDAPALPRGILRIIKMNQQTASPEAGPTIVHCSSGVGRTGVYLAISMAIERVSEGDGEVDFFQLVMRLREKRVSMVQTQAQYRFLFDAMQEYIKTN
jgi:netrin-G3 ligand